MNSGQFFARTVADAKIFAELFVEEAQSLLLQPRDRAVVVALRGDLGAGKTTFVRLLARKLGIKAKIQSPTFLIMKSYDFNIGNKKFNLVHSDWYRLKDRRDLSTLGFNDIISDPKNLIMIEWPERIRRIIPKPYILISIDIEDARKRVFRISIKK